MPLPAPPAPVDQSAVATDKIEETLAYHFWLIYLNYFLVSKPGAALYELLYEYLDHGLTPRESEVINRRPLSKRGFHSLFSILTMMQIEDEC